MKGLIKEKKLGFYHTVAKIRGHVILILSVEIDMELLPKRFLSHFKVNIF